MGELNESRCQVRSPLTESRSNKVLFKSFQRMIDPQREKLVPMGGFN